MTPVKTSYPSLLLGRDRELAELQATLELAGSGRGDLVLLSGEAGIGKSAVLRACAQRAAQRGFVVTSGTCWEEAGAPPLWPWIQVLRGLLRTDEGTRALEVLGEYRGLVESLLNPTPQPVEHGGSARFALFDAVARLLQESSLSRPMLLSLDDLHAADEASLALLDFVAKIVPASRAVVAATHRPPPGDRQDVFAALARHGRRIILGPLAAGDSVSLFEAVSGTTPTPTEQEQVVVVSGGNPLLVCELGSVARNLAHPSLGDSATPLDGVRATLRLRLMQLSAPAIEMLEAAAVVGRQGSNRVLAAVCGLTSEDVAEHTRRAAEFGILTATGDGWRFTHDLVRSVLYEATSASRRAVLHARAADAIELAADDDDERTERAAEIANHLIRADSPELRHRAVSALRAAGDLAVGRFAYEAAEKHYRDALELLVPDAPEVPDVLIEVAQAQLMRGRKANGRATILHAVALAHRRGDVVSAAASLAALAELNYINRSESDAEVVALVDELLPLLNPQRAHLRNSLMALRGMELWALAPGRSPVTHLPEIRRGIAAAERDNDGKSLTQALRTLLIVTGPDDIEERLAASRRLLSHALDEGLPGSELFGRASLLGCALETGDFLTFDNEVGALVARAARLSHPLHLWVARSAQSCQAAIRGEFDKVVELADEAMSLSQQAEHAAGRVAFALAQISVSEHRGTLADVEPMIAMARDMAPEGIPSRAGLAVIAAESGRPQEALAELGPLMAMLDHLPKTVQWLQTVGLMGRAAAGAAHAGMCARMYPVLLPYEDRHHYMTLGHPVSYHGSIAHILGRLSRVVGDDDRALHHFERALTLHESLGAPAWTAWTQLELARLLLHRGEREHPRAQVLARSAGAIAEEFGLSAITEKLESWSHDALPPRTERSLGIVAEGDYWSITYRGRTFRMKDMRGWHYLATLLSDPGREFHALDLVMMVTGGTRSDIVAEGASVSDEAVLDPTAKAAYRRRLEDLEQEIDDAEVAGDSARRDKAQHERDFLLHQLTSALGIGGRPRTWSDPGEKARISVAKSLKRVIDRITEQDRELGRLVGDAVQTGMYCSFREPTEQWSVSVKT